MVTPVSERNSENGDLNPSVLRAVREIAAKNNHPFYTISFNMLHFS